MKRALSVLLVLLFVTVLSACREPGENAPSAEPLPVFDGVYRLSAGGEEYELKLLARNGAVLAQFLSPASLAGLSAEYDGGAVTFSIAGVTGTESAADFSSQTAFGAFLRAVAASPTADGDALIADADGTVSAFSAPDGSWRLRRTGDG